VAPPTKETPALSSAERTRTLVSLEATSDRPATTRRPPAAGAQWTSTGTDSSPSGELAWTVAATEVAMVSMPRVFLPSPCHPPDTSATCCDHGIPGVAAAPVRPGRHDQARLARRPAADRMRPSGHVAYHGGHGEDALDQCQQGDRRPARRGGPEARRLH